MNTLKSLVAIAVGLCSYNAYASEEQSLDQQVETLNQRIAQLENDATTSASAFENTQMNLYGSFRPTLSYFDKDETVDVRDALSRIGIKASTDFGDGWSGFAHGEWGIDIANSGNFGKGRKAFAGIASPYGQIAIGRQRTAQYTLVAEYVDIFNHGNSPFAFNQESPFFADNFVTYQLVSGDFTWMAGAQVDGDTGENGVDMINLGVGYDIDQLHLGLGYASQNTMTDTGIEGDDKTIFGVVSYTFSNDLYLAVSYQDKKYNYDAQSNDRSGGTLDSALSYPIAKNYKIKLGYYQFKDGIKDNTSADYDGFNTTLEWNPLSNVRVHLEYLVMNSDHRADDNALTLGFKYDFSYSWK